VSKRCNHDFDGGPLWCQRCGAGAEEAYNNAEDRVEALEERLKIAEAALIKIVGMSQSTGELENDAQDTAAVALALLREGK
jgi:hypothetical protein